MPASSKSLTLFVSLLVGLQNSLIAAGSENEGCHEFRIIGRTVSQERTPFEVPSHDQKQRWSCQAWQVDYSLQLEGPTGLILTPAEIAAKVEGWVANSRITGHTVPLWSVAILRGTTSWTACVNLVEAADELERCRERVMLTIWVDDDLDVNAKSVLEVAHDDPDVLPYPRPIFSIAPGGVIRVRLTLAHEHFLYGVYDLLLGRRQLELQLGPALVHDTLLLGQEKRACITQNPWGVLPEDRRDCRHFVSAPDSLHLEAHVPGNQSYRFPERPVRYCTRMRLSYWYLVAPGTEGECRARIAQNKETPTQFKILAEGSHEQCLSVVGRWTHVERVFCTEPEATDLVLDFRIAGADVGEVWIDDVVLEPVDGNPLEP